MRYNKRFHVECWLKNGGRIELQNEGIDVLGVSVCQLSRPESHGKSLLQSCKLVVDYLLMH